MSGKRNPLSELNLSFRESPTSSPKPPTQTPNPAFNSSQTSPLPLRFSTDPNMPTTPQTARELRAEGSELAYPSSDLSSNRQRSTPLVSTPRSQRSDLRAPGLFDRLNPSSDIEDPADVRTVIWGTSVNIQESINMFRQFLLSFTLGHKKRSLGQDYMVSEQDDELFYLKLFQQMRAEDQFNMNLDCSNLKAYGPSQKLYHQLVRFPQEIIPVMDFTATQLFMEQYPEVDLQDRGLVVRPFNLDRQVNMRQLDPSDIDQLITVKGLLIRSSPVLPDMKKGFFKCCICEQTVLKEIDRGRIQEPNKCPNEQCMATNTMRLIHNRCEFSNKQIARMQETPDETPDGQTPYTVSMYLYDDLVDVCKPGDRLEVTGIYRAVPCKVNPRRKAVKAQFKTFMDVVHVKRTSDSRLGVDAQISKASENKTDYVEGDNLAAMSPEQEQEILEFSKSPALYEILSNSISPSIFGMDDVKKGVLLQLFGGASAYSNGQVQVERGSGLPRIRGDINVLIVGDPGLAKSQLLKYVHQVAPRGIYTSGKGSSAVGLTAYITRDPDSNQLVLESGALVLSDGGVCCIDEFDKMSDQTRSVLHEVMEQQTISIAKAGIITTLNARTSILASANPIKSKFDERLSVVENINIPPPLLSRFDLLYLVLDKPNEQDDRRLAQHILSLYQSEPTVQTNIVPIEFFAKYVNYAKLNVHPVLSDEAANCLVEYYVNMRQWGKSESHNVVTATTRQLESMIRLSQAHAKMRLSSSVQVEDVVESHRLISTAMQKTCIDPLTGKLDLDMITTGISSRQLENQSKLRKTVLGCIQESESDTLRFIELYALVNEKQKLTELELSSLLETLCLEELIGIRGKNNSDKVIMRK